MPPHWRLILDGAHSAPSNMAIDEAIALSHNDSCPFDATLRFYEWTNPSISLGFGQPYFKAVNEEFCKKNNIEIVRRPTGGRAVLHHREITYSFCACYKPPFSSSNIIDSYKKISNAMVNGLKNSLSMNVAMSPGQKKGLSPDSATPCFAASSNSEITNSEGAKAIGSAQRRWENAFLQHGSIPITMDYELLKGTTGCDDNIKDLIAPLSSLTPVSISPDQVARAIIKGFEEYFGISFTLSSLTEHERTIAEKLTVEKYENKGWNEKRRITRNAV